MMAKLRETSLSVVNIGIITLNLDTRLREVLVYIFRVMATGAGPLWRPWRREEPYGPISWGHVAVRGAGRP